MNSSKQTDRPTIARTNSTVTTIRQHSTLIPQKRSLDGDSQPMLNKKPHFIRRSKNCTNYTQACLLLHAIEINRRQLLDPRCIAHLANYVVKAWETDPDETKVRQLYLLMQNLLSTTAIKQSNLENALTTFCQNTASTPTPCPSVTLLIAIGYIERLNKKYDIVKGTVGCGSRLIIIAYLMAAKFLHDNLRLIIHVPTNSIPSQLSTNSTRSIEQPSSSSQQQQRPATITSIFSPERPEPPPSSTSLSSSPSNASATTILPTSPPKSPPSLDTLITNSVMSPHRYLQHPPTPNIPPLTPPLASRSITTTANTLKPAHTVRLHSEQPDLSSSSSSSIATEPSPSPPPSSLPNERYLRIMRLELEFLHFLDYDLSTPDPAKLVRWAHTFDTQPPIDDGCTSADEGDDEMEDDDDGLDTCILD